MLAKNEVLQGRYRIVRQLGHGGMGAVYEAKDERLGSSVALKEIIIDLDQIPTTDQRELFRRAFEREAKLLANLHHEVFPRVMDYFSEENRQFLIMELVHGEDLGELLKKNKTSFALEGALRWADQLLDALDYLHTQPPPIYHRDIKPQNLKVTSRGKIKLLDFGIAKSVDQTASTVTNQTFVAATLEYAPIEQILPAIAPTFREFIILKHSEKANAVLNQTTDARCDIYAVGATFYHLLTAHIPIGSAKRSLEIWEGNADPLPKPREINEEIPLTISAWLMKAMEIARDNRFSSALEMQKALQTAIAGAKDDGKTSEKTLNLLEPKIASVEKENYFPKAVAESPIEIKQSSIKTEPKINSETQNPEIETLIPPVSSTESPITETLTVEASETSFSESTSKPELARNAYATQKTIEERRPEPASARFSEPKAASKSGFNSFWLLSIFAVGLLTVGGIGGGMVWLNGSISTDPNKPVSNTKISTPTGAPTISPTSSPTVSPTSQPTPEPTSSNPIVGGEKPKPTIVPTPDKTPKIQSPVKTPQPQKTSKPKPQQDPNCVFTNSCQ